MSSKRGGTPMCRHFALPDDPTDSTLIRLGEEFDRLDAAFKDAVRREDEVEIDRIFERKDAIVNAIAPMMAHTRAGLAVKARAYAWHRDGIHDDPADGLPRATRLADSIARDLLQGGADAGAIEVPPPTRLGAAAS